MDRNTDNKTRKGTVQKKSQVINPETGLHVKRDAATGQFMDMANGRKPSKGKNQHVIPTKEGWAVRGETNTKNTKIFSAKAEAESYARKIAKNQQTRLVIHSKDGKIQSANSYGNASVFSRGITKEEVQKLAPALKKLADYDKKGKK